MHHMLSAISHFSADDAKFEVNNNAKKIVNTLFIIFINTPFLKQLFHYESDSKSI